MPEGSQSTTDSDGNEEVDIGVAAIATALNHPLRRRLLLEWGDGEASPSDLVAQVGRPLSNISYHVRVLVACGVLELVRTEPVRGSIEHFYVSKASSDNQLRSLLFDNAPRDGRPQTAP